MEVKREEVTQDRWDEMKKVIRENVCGECGGELQIHTTGSGSLEVWCPHNPDHHGYVERETYTQSMRRGVDIHPAIRGHIEKRMLPGGYEIGTAMALIKTRFPRADFDDPSAALFIMDCMRLDLDPLLGEIFPVTFKSKDKAGVERKVVQPIIAEDGWLSLASRACPERWVGPPRTYRLEDYLRTLEENQGKSAEEIKELAKEIKKDTCGDESAHYWMAWGNIKVGDTTMETAASPGWLAKKDYEKAKEHGTPAGQFPGNQARVRAIKRWVRENFPEAKSKMKDITAEWLRRGKDFDDVEQIIEAEYHIVTEEPPPSKPEGDKKSSEPPAEVKGEPGKGGAGEASFLSTKGTKTKKIGASARDPISIKSIEDLKKACREDFGLSPEQMVKELGYSSERDISELPADCYRMIAAVR